MEPASLELLSRLLPPRAGRALTPPRAPG
jgi:hypothetical protein